jgi:hypothetical protein
MYRTLVKTPPPPTHFEKQSLFFFSVLINRPIFINTGNICIYMYVRYYFCTHSHTHTSTYGNVIHTYKILLDCRSLVFHIFIESLNFCFQLFITLYTTGSPNTRSFIYPSFFCLCSRKKQLSLSL